MSGSGPYAYTRPRPITPLKIVHVCVRDHFSSPEIDPY